MDDRAAAPGCANAPGRTAAFDRTAACSEVAPLLEVRDLSIGFVMYQGRALTAPRRMVHVIDRLSLSVRAGEVLALVGASGSGKSLLADAIMGLFARNAQVTGSIRFAGAALDKRAWERLRGRQIAFVPQSVESLDPLMRVGRQLEEMALDMRPPEAVARRRALFGRYRLDESIADRYPFELSGGMARRVLLIGALMNEPRLLVADEPTPGLDQELAVRAMGDLRAFADAGGAVLFITHDIELALRVSDRIAVFHEGAVVEEATVEQFAAPERLVHPLSRALWHALPEHDFCSGAAPSCRSASTDASVVPCGPSVAAASSPQGARMLAARGLRFTYPCGRTVIDGVDLSVAPGDRVAVCAPSGRGKTTLCRLLSGYLQPQAGSVTVDGSLLARRARRLLCPPVLAASARAGVARLRDACPVQLVGQHPEHMMDPLLRVRASLAEALGVGRASDARLEDELGELMDALGVKRAWLDRYPLELSGGELQRCCIVRALAARPAYLVCDEMTTMLDAVSQARVWHAVIDLADRRGMGMVVVSHSPALIDRIATRRFDL